jgi:hypothetical protein
MKKNGHGFMIKVRILYSGRRSTVVDGECIAGFVQILIYLASWIRILAILSKIQRKEGQFITLQGGSLYFSFHQKWSKLDALFQTNANEKFAKSAQLLMKTKT